MKLTSAQQTAVNHIDGHLQIIACAGSGKTEVISRRIANILNQKPGVNPENIVAFTFTEKAAASLKARIESAFGAAVPGMYIGTIHGFCRYLLNKYTEQFANYKVLDPVKNHLFVNRYADHCGMTALGLKPCTINNNLFLQCLGKLIDDYDNRESWTENQRTVLDQYMQCLYSHGYIDFSLLLFEAFRQMQENPSIQRYLESIQYLIVDEYQDVDDLQEKLIAAMANHGANICVVGDDDQTIYRFRGSNADNMIAFSARYPGVQQVRLEENFRCQKGIIDVAANVICHNERRLQKQMHSAAIEKDSTVCATGYVGEEEEFSAVAEQIERVHKQGVPYGQIAVLVRKGRHVASMAKRLEQDGIPYAADSAEAFFTGDYFNRFVETLRMLESIDKAALYERWKDCAAGAQFNVGFKYLRSCTRGGSYRLSEILRGFCDKIEFLRQDAGDLQIRTEDLEGICRILDDYDEIYGDYQLSARVTGVLRFLGTQAAQEYRYHSFRQADPDTDAVQLMTVHKSKGLEFHTVFLPRLNKREFPVARMGGKKYYHVLEGSFAENKNRYESDIEDERKLFYVAITRARQNLYLSYTLEKQPVSEFVSDAAESQYLKIDRSDLRYQPSKAEKLPKAYDDAHTDVSDTQRQQWEQEKAEREKRREQVKYARDRLYEEYSIANHFCKGIMLEYQAICKEGDDAILAKAQEWGLI